MGNRTGGLAASGEEGVGGQAGRQAGRQEGRQAGSKVRGPQYKGTDPHMAYFSVYITPVHLISSHLPSGAFALL